MYTLMLKAAFCSNKSVETFVMGTILDSLIGGGQIGGIKGMSPGSATLSLSQTTTLLFRLFPHCGSWPQANIY